ncbi:hypothetical protein HPB49_004254 [Dermacentor silvarum]|uniref:Uncharacterized protein n=1 Tax=Dermacentor silvarum TaxID=543639 RepID=A0ACB8DTT9_DERSI|nr:hypothetical protein HPB49_004254 [Dermacentor silvarum]
MEISAFGVDGSTAVDCGGPVHFLGGQEKAPAAPIPKVMDDWIQEYGKVFGFYEGELPKVVISDLDMIKECFVKEAHMFRDRMPLIIEVEPIKSSLLALRGDEWKRVRSVLNPTFSSAKMKLMSQVMNACGNTLVEVMSERLAVGQDTIDVTKTSQALSMDVITKCALAWQVDCQRNVDDPTLRLLQRIFLEVDQHSGQEERRHAAAYVPFGLGPRECIGRRFALLELKTVLAKLVRTYVFSVCDDADDPIKLTVPTVTLNPVRNIKLRVTRRSS